MKKLAIGMAVFCFMMMTSGAVWCENRVPIPPNGTILDTSTGLVWLQNGECFGLLNWQNATNAAAGLKSGSCGLTDGSTAGKWRLPTKDQLSNRQKNKNGFSNIQPSAYWSSSSSGPVLDEIWTVNMQVGGAYSGSKSEGHYVLPVRDGQ